MTDLLMPNGFAAPKPFVMVGYPSGDLVHAEFALCMAAVSRSYNGKLGWTNGRHSVVANARNNCVDQVQNLKADYIMFFDSDMVFPPETLTRLLAHRKDIVGALYPRRAPPYDVLGKTLTNQPMQVSGGLQEMASVPTGCLLIKMSVFNALTKPYFRHKETEGQTMVGPEDYEFCVRARAKGFKVYADIDLSMEIGHIGSRIYTAGADQKVGGVSANAA